MTPPTPLVRIVASNLHDGGAVQVGASLVEEIVGLSLSGVRLEFEVSPEVAENLSTQTLSCNTIHIVNRNTQSIGAWWRDVRSPAAVAFVVFGPAWFPIRAKRLVVGYADVTALYGVVQGVPGQTLSKRIFARIRGSLSIRDLGRYDRIIVETEAIATRIGNTRPGLLPRIAVVPNAISKQASEGGREFEPRQAQQVMANRVDGELTFLYTTASYPHKNLEFLPRLRESMKTLGVDVKFLVTLTPREWNEMSNFFRDACRNLGRLSLAEIRAAHTLSDAVVFPSLLEASSATPLEAMALGTPLLAADRDFTRTVCGNAALYFDPLDADSAARVIVSGLRETDAVQQRVTEGVRITRSLPDARSRAQTVASLLLEAASP